MEEERPDPDLLLHQIASETEENAPKAGRLKIFFGYAAGVGKTYTMLEAAHAAEKAGMDVVVGYVEPHTRPDTTALAQGLETLPPLVVNHRGVTLKEFDLDAALARAPQLIVVDELAHTNAEECRHRKRYQDVEELLRAGISVYTTVNVQHIESLNDIVQAITGVAVQERIPDRVFDSAWQVEIVDIEPDDLIERLHEGKIYRQTQAQKALSNFFTRDNLVALREIALRRIADHVNRAAEKERSHSQRSAPATEEQILICLSSSPSNAKVIRTAARLADAFRGSFTALFVETPNSPELEESNRVNLRKNLKLAEQLGAKVATVYGEDIAYQISEYAKLSGITKIVLGRSTYKKRWLPQVSLAQQLTTLAPEVDVYIIPDAYTPQKPVRKKKAAFRLSGSSLLVASLVMLATMSLAFFFSTLGFTGENILIFFILGILCTAMFTSGRMYSIVFSLVGILLFNFFFTEPRYSLTMYNTGYQLTFFIVLLAAFIASSLSTRAQNQARQLVQQTHRTEIMLDTSQSLQKAKSIQDIYEVAGKQIRKLMNTSVLIYPAQDGKLQTAVVFPESEETQMEDYTGSSEQAVAQWVYKNNKHAGATTNTLPGAACLYLAVRSNQKVFAVAAIVVGRNTELSVADKSLMLGMLNEIALALEKEENYQSQSRAAIMMEQEKLQSNLLRAISHDFRTPLTSISGNAGMLMQNGPVLDEEKKQELYSDIYEDSLWLVNLMENLLSITRMEQGVTLHTRPELVQEVVQEAVTHMARRSQGHIIQVNIEDDMLMAKIDSRLIIQVLVNMMDNALKYTQAGSTITISAQRSGNDVALEVADDGPGISSEEKGKVLEMFYTADNAQQDGRRGLGLGLFLCKTIIEAHGGELSVRDNRPKGTVFRFTLPWQEVKSDGQ